MASDLLIKINADAENAKKAFDDVRSKSEELEGGLNKIALISAAAFAAFTAEIHLSVKAFQEAEAASAQLSNALQNQGIYTKELTDLYKGYAVAVQDATGIDDDAITKAQAVAQSFLGQTKISRELTFAIADLGATMGGDLNAAAEKIGRTIGTSTNAFAKQGVKIDETATSAERMAKVLEFVGAKASGLATDFNRTDGYTKALHTSFGNLQEQIGARLAPAAASFNQTLIKLFNYIESSPGLVDFIAAFLRVGVVITASVAIIAAAIPVYLALSAAATTAAATFGIAFNVAFAGIPLLIGVVIGAVVLLVANWDKAMAGMKAAATGMVTLIGELFRGLGGVMQGALNFSPTEILAGLKRIALAHITAAATAVNTYQDATAVVEQEAKKQSDVKAKAAAKIAAEEAAHQALLVAIRRAGIDLLKFQNENASAETIALKTKEIEVLKALDSEKSDAEKALLKQRLGIIRGLQDQQNQEDLERQVAFAQIKSASAAELANAGIAVEAEISNVRLAAIQATANIEADIDRKLQDDLLTKRIQARNTELLEKKKFGVAYAVINKAMHSDEVQGAKSAAGELVQLTQSKSATLKSIGKVAAVASIAISTAESAMNIFKGFSMIPIVGPALGIAGAAAAVAFGAERIEAVTAAADGGLITGGMPGRDSVPAMLMPGELVVPKQNFEQVVSSYSATKPQDSAPAQGPGFAEIVITLKDDIANFIETKLVERQRIGISMLTTKLA